MKRALVVIGLVFALSMLALAQAAPSTGAAHPEMVVSTAWMAEHLNDTNVVLLHVAGTKATYDKEHIPGARYLGDDGYMDEHVGATDELPSAQRIKKVLEDLGVTDKTRVVIYATDWFPYAARVWFTLDYFGHGNHASLLDGGIEQWKLEKRPVTKEQTAAVRRGVLTIHEHPEDRALLQQVKAIADGGAGKDVLLDSRPAGRYKSGHLSGASNLYWKETLVSDESPVLLPPEKLRELFVARGVTPGSRAVTYCEVGIQASHDYFVAKYLGYDAAMYDGSYFEWEKLQDLPVVKGEQKK
jgi:thiosulfate/3-mercaptopyruvate sulfurtransferase